jgi:predicted amidophosphoribosyltransferase
LLVVFPQLQCSNNNTGDDHRNEDAVKQIFGNWDLGYALDKHSISSTPIGENEQGHMQFETLRTEVGEATFQLKYRDKWDQVAPLAETIRDTLCSIFPGVGFVIPMPASNVRARQPVNEVAGHLAGLLDVPMFDKILVKTPNGKSLKNLKEKGEKAAALEGTISLNRQITNEGKCSWYGD